MKIGILAAMDKELALLLPLLDNMKETDFDGRRAYIGSVGRNEVCVMKCGIGKVNSALNAFRLISHFHPDLVINSGVAGGADPSMKIGSLLVCTQAAYHDVWCGPGTVEGQMDGSPARFDMDKTVVDACRALWEGALPTVKLKQVASRPHTLADDNNFRFGLICSGDRFISTAEEVAHIKSIYPDALACDMESASIAQACFDCGVPFAVLRVVSDTPGQGENISQYKNFWTEAPEKTFHALRSLLLYL